MMTRITGALVVFVSLIMINPLHAATFCLGGYGISPQCVYDDVSNCRRAADPPSTACLINPDAVLTYNGGARYCIASSSLVAECFYIDRSQCDSDALRRNAVCVDRNTMADKNNPFKDDVRVQY